MSVELPDDGWVDLHCHYLPAIDDGVRTLDEGVDLCRRLRGAGFTMVVATPHIRTAMFENRKPGLEAAYAAFVEATRGERGLPVTGLGAEHFFDDVFWALFAGGEAVPYPGGHAALVELSERSLPLGLDHRFFEMQVRRVRPVLAHPERYAAFRRSSAALEPLVDVGALPLLDLMSLVGKYGRSAKKAAERMLAEDLYYAACSDCHRPHHVDLVRDAIERLRRLVGAARADALLGENPRRILRGEVTA